jgi:hypothetical protein
MHAHTHTHNVSNTIAKQTQKVQKGIPLGRVHGGYVVIKPALVHIAPPPVWALKTRPIYVLVATHVVRGLKA